MRDNRMMSDFMRMSKDELMGICIGKGYDYNIDELENMCVSDVASRYNGVGNSTIAVAMSAIALGRKTIIKENLGEIKCSTDAFKAVCNDLIGIDHEAFYAVFLDQRCKIVKKYKVSEGGITTTPVDVRIIFQQALACKAVSLVVAHNHPSANLEPSKADKSLTKRIIEAGELIGVKLLDHIIVGAPRGVADYYSFSENGLI